MPLPKNIPMGQPKENKFTPPPLPDIEGKEPILGPQEEEGAFVSLGSDEINTQDLEEQVQDEGLGDYIEQEIVEEQAQKQRVQEELRNNPQIEDPFIKGSEAPDDDDKFIDKKKVKIKPFGGKKSKKKSNTVRAKDFDDRKNTLTMVKAVRLIMLIFVVGMFAFGVKNTFFPAHIYTQEDIASISRQAIGQTGFPTNRGRALAEQFTQEYFEVNSDDDNSRRVYQSFFAGGPESASGEIAYSGKNHQKVLVPPRTFSESAVSENIAYYYVSTLVSGRNGESFTESGEQTSKWVALAVTVYYDSKTQELSIAKDSPQLIPSFEVASNAAQPQEKLLGTGAANPDLFETMGSTIKGFTKAYAASTSSAHGEAEQYVKNNSDPSVFAGFGGKFTVDTDDLDSTTVSIYPSSDAEDNKEWKVDMQVTWDDATNVSPQDQLSFTGRYVMTLEKSKDGKYFVTAFRPYVFSPQPAEAEE